MGFFSKIFGDSNKKKFKEVRVDKETLESFLYYAREAFPNEFLALLDGKIEDEVLYITGLIFMPGETSDTGAVLHTGMLPPTLDFWGSIHSHPGPSAEPSDADLATFSKHGVFHMIVCLPYSIQTIKAYNKHGEPVELLIGDYRNMVSDEEEKLAEDFFDENDDFDDEFIEEEYEDNEIISNEFLNDSNHSIDEPQINFDDDIIDIPINKPQINPNPISNNNQPNRIVIDAETLKEGGVINIQIDEQGNVKKIDTDTNQKIIPQSNEKLGKNSKNMKKKNKKDK
ncbi:Mov34/MPN/PAD-1 family protein [Methanobrevibacter sp. OttesenSCG-928-K11]|nr:Mov34/MPN/PAD-1 family protein [Methanobrevibacter sp. OttesenSCG-928-K11]MDL2270854.1 Mov34/MPN/PAD-1 family protein [Methanobrevibacter sp. OttesenSCG-928-I08]